MAGNLHARCPSKSKCGVQQAFYICAVKYYRESALRLSGLFLRRKSDKEFYSYIPLLNYCPDDYEVLLRVWGSEPFPRHLGAFSGPMIAGEDPEVTLLMKSKDWTKKLASE